MEESEVVDYSMDNFSFYEPCPSDSIQFMHTKAPNFNPLAEVSQSSIVSLHVIN